jgi:uncharacterized YccA/Bax inhibitor family protein
MRTANPALNANTFSEARPLSGAQSGATTGTMTVNGTVNRTAVLLAIAGITATFAWEQSLRDAPNIGDAPVFVPSAWLIIGGIGGFITAIVTIFKKTWAPMTAPVYAAFEGLLLGGVSAGFNVLYPGIVLQAVMGTFGTLAALLFAYRSGLIRATENFKLGVAAATGGIAIIYLVGFVMSFFGAGIPYIHESGMIGIGFSLFVVVIAALNLVLDFDFIEQGAARGAPKYLEWYAAFGLLVTLVWLYFEMLRLLAKLRDRR